MPNFVNETQKKFLDEIQQLARSSGLEDTLILAKEILEPTDLSSNLILVTSQQLEEVTFIEWIRGQNLPAIVKASEDIINRPESLSVFFRTIFLFQYGKIMSSADIQAFSNVVATRPRGSYAVVFQGCEKISEDNDLVWLNKISRRLLIPELRNSGSSQIVLSDYNIFLWSDNTIDNQIHSQIHEDKSKFLEWLSDPKVDPNRWQQYQNSSLITLAEGECGDKFSSSESSEEPEQIQKISKAKSDLNEYCSRFQTRVTRELEITKDEVIHHLETLESDFESRVDEIFIGGQPESIESEVQKINKDVNKILETCLEHLYERIKSDQIDLSSRFDSSFIDEFGDVSFSETNRSFHNELRSLTAQVITDVKQTDESYGNNKSPSSEIWQWQGLAKGAVSGLLTLGVTRAVPLAFLNQIALPAALVATFLMIKNEKKDFEARRNRNLGEQIKQTRFKDIQQPLKRLLNSSIDEKFQEFVKTYVGQVKKIEFFLEKKRDELKSIPLNPKQQVTALSEDEIYESLSGLRCKYLPKR